ncbi:hypothetical protein EA658_09745 [Pseudoxanthomonas winnipegensis]|uniref:Uncharacterized protein n=1 Tax=Pseudoxanthomonas winnipegensis TaxID=2480810 RepID=A0ABY1WCR5_9GAMM|nr:hypothetical protein [Pseudoxanthomonas winnipegensis]TAA12482.1 hypothetical protein EA659_03905 [Pseudoxanthomonas winnipegensis]TAA19153.1 hypothetical protein EA658_09745 [Pseudoxanthomonas winnipegensis]TAH70414.1 hypothetical protein EA657_16810 [Pseudoxanthomonas winnipegensis]
MATLSDFANVLYQAYSEAFDPSVERTEMERGIPKQRLVNSQVLMKISASLLFRSASDVSAFEDWYFNDLKRIGWFTIMHPRTGVPTTVRFENGSIGTLTPQAPAFWLAQRDVVLEYMR